MRYFVGQYDWIRSRHNNLNSAVTALLRRMKRERRYYGCGDSLFAVEKRIWYFIPLVVFKDYKSWCLGRWNQDIPDEIKRAVQSDYFVSKFVARTLCTKKN